MAGLPARCENCGAIFVSNVVNVGLGAQDITFINNQVPCPNCGHNARAIDGTFDFVGNAITVKRAPPRTIEILRVLQEALRKAELGIPPAEVISSIEKASPALGAAIKRVPSSRGKTGLISLLLLLLAGSCSTNTNLSLNWNQLVDQVHVYATGSDPYPNLGTPSAQQHEPKITRQQRRHQERQAEKAQRKTERSKPKPTKRP